MVACLRILDHGKEFKKETTKEKVILTPQNKNDIEVILIKTRQNIYNFDWFIISFNSNKKIDTVTLWIKKNINM